MEIFSALLAICAGNSPVTGDFPAQRPVTRSFDVFCDLRRHRAHYDVIIMKLRDAKYDCTLLLLASPLLLTRINFNPSTDK